MAVHCFFGCRGRVLKGSSTDSMTLLVIGLPVPMGSWFGERPNPCLSQASASARIEKRNYTGVIQGVGLSYHRGEAKEHVMKHATGTRLYRGV